MTAVLGLQIAASAAEGVTPPVSGFGEINRVGSSVNYGNHPSINPSQVGMQDQYEAWFRYFDESLRSALGLPAGTKVLAGPHRYQGSVPSNWSNVELRWAYPDYNWGLQNMVISSSQWANVAAGSLDATFTSLAYSVPAPFTLICGPAHEPENNGPFPSQDGGTWQAINGENWSRMLAHLAELFVTLNLPNFWLAVIHMGDTFPTNGQPGSLGNNQKDPEAWNPYKYMSAAAKARTIAACDVYTAMQDNLGTSSSYTKLTVKHQRIVDYMQAAGWGVSRIGISEHTINNDILASDAHVAAAIRDDVRVHLRNLKNAGKLAYYAHFDSSTGLASGDNGWWDQPEELTEAGAMVREINVGSSGTGTTGVAFVAASGNTKNDSAPSLTPVGAVGDYAVVQFSCRDTVTLTDPAGWTVHVAQDVGGGRYRVYGKFLAGTETSTNVVPSMGATVSRWAAEMLAYSGVHATPINGTPGVATSDVANTVQVTGTTTTTVAGCTILSLATDRSGSIVITSWSPPAGYTGRSQVVQTSSAGATAAAADRSNVPIGDYGGDQWTSNVAAGAWCGVTMALRPA